MSVIRIVALKSCSSLLQLPMFQVIDTRLKGCTEHSPSSFLSWFFSVSSCSDSEFDGEEEEEEEESLIVEAVDSSSSRELAVCEKERFD